MKLKVTTEGVVIPKKVLEDFEEVEIRKINGVIFVIPTTTLDPILELGKNPVVCGVPDASEHHETYLYSAF